MLRLLLFAILDVKSEAFFPPLAFGTVSEALRAFGDLLSDPQSRLAKHPQDYRLYRIGEFDVMGGVVTPCKEGVVLVEEGLQLIKEA